MKKIISSKKTVLCCLISLLALCLLFGFTLPNNAKTVMAGNITVPGGSLVSTGDLDKEGKNIKWGVTGNPAGWSCSMEEIFDETQYDGGDVILLNAYSGSEFIPSMAGCSRQSNYGVASMDVFGLHIKYYVTEGWQYEIYFTENSGWYLSSDHHFSLYFKNQNTVDLRVGAKDYHTTVATCTTVNMNEDYDYFGDPKGNDNTPGTANEIAFVPYQGAFWIKINGVYAFNLNKLGVIEDWILPCRNIENHKMFFTIYKRNYKGGAFKITDMYNDDEGKAGTGVSRIGDMTSGVFDGFTLTRSTANYKYNTTGEMTISGTNASFLHEGNVGIVNLKDFTIEQRVKLNNNNDSELIQFWGGSDGSDMFALGIKRISSNQAEIYYARGGTSTKLGTTTFDFSGTVTNTISLKKSSVKNYLATVNGIPFKIDAAILDGCFAKYNDGAAWANYDFTSTFEFSLMRLLTNPLKEVDILPEDYLVTGENVKAQTEGNGYMVYNTADTPFTIKYLSGKVYADCFTVNYKYGKNEDNTKPIKIKVGNNLKYIQIKIIKAAANTANVVVSAVSPDYGETEVLNKTVPFDFSYESGIKTVQFVGDGNSKYGVLSYKFCMTGTGSYTADDVLEFDRIDDPDFMDAIEDAAADNDGFISFEVEGDANTAVYLDTYYNYAQEGSQVTWSGGWRQGELQSAEFAYNPKGDVFIINDLGYSYKKSTTIFFDGFTINVKTYAQRVNESAYWELTNGINTRIGFTASYNPEEPDKAVFTFLYTNLEEGEFLYIDSDAFRKPIKKFTVDWNWNNCVDNVISINFIDGAWILAINDFATDEFSNVISEIYTLFENIDFDAYFWIEMGSGQAWDFTLISEQTNHSPYVVTGQPNFDDFYRYGKTVKINLKKVFRDPDGDPLTFSFAENQRGEIKGNYWTFKVPPSTDDGYFITTILASDGKGGEAFKEFSVLVKKYDKSIDGEIKKPGEQSCKFEFTTDYIIILAIIVVLGTGFIILRAKS